MTAIALPRKKHSHRCKVCREGVYCYKTKCTLPQRIEACANCQWKAENERKSKVVRVTFYFPATGREQSSHDCDTVEEAFERLERTKMPAMAFRPHGRVSGTYVWRPDADNTLEALKAKLWP